MFHCSVILKTAATAICFFFLLVMLQHTFLCEMSFHVGLQHHLHRSVSHSLGKSHSQRLNTVLIAVSSLDSWTLLVE